MTATNPTVSQETACTFYNFYQGSAIPPAVTLILQPLPYATGLPSPLRGN